VTDKSHEEVQKHHWQRISTEEGIQIDRNPRRNWNAPLAIRFSLDPDSNVDEESHQYPEKHLSQRALTAAGIQINRPREQRGNASVSIPVNLDPDSNLNDKIQLQ
jgi:hypothetical protein